MVKFVADCGPLLGCWPRKAFTYTYHSGEEKVTKQAIVQFDRGQRRYGALGEPLPFGTETNLSVLLFVEGLPASAAL